MFAQNLGLTLATATVHSDSDLIDVSAVFSDEVEAAIEFAQRIGYSQLDQMIDEMHSIKLVRLHLAQARWEHEEDVSDATRATETMFYPLTFKPATRRAMN